MSTDNSDNIILGNPTKEFFINMLTRDIRLDRAILDLVDNSIDGAKSLKGNDNYTGLTVEISLSKDKFEVIDNCGGFDLETAKNYAFRFGRPDNVEAVRHSVGRFGVGMKRALFKMGKHFMVESKSGEDHFLVEIDVNNWLSNPDPTNWNFTYVEKEDIPEEKSKIKDFYGTVITVSSLYDNISNDFDDNTFLNELEKEMSLALNYSILKGLSVNLNNKPIVGKDILLIESAELKPFFNKLNVGGVTVRIYAGVGKPEPSNAGWYIFCNDRLVMEADKSYVTGWKESKEDEGSIMKYHNKQAMFRGVVFLDAEDSRLLPMTTTKTGIDFDHAVYKKTRLEMLNAMRQVTNFLNKINDKEERDELVVNAEKLDITTLQQKESTYTSTFIFPDILKKKEASKFVSISYSREREVVERMKNALGVSSNREVGEQTFDYFAKMNEI